MTAGFSVSLQRIAEPSELEADWRRLEAVAEPPFFLSWDWAETWLRNIDRPAYAIRVMRDGQTVALGLACRHRQVRHRILRVDQIHINASGDREQDIIALEYNGLLARREDATPALDAAIAALLSPKSEAAQAVGKPEEVVLPRVDALIEQRLAANGWSFWKATEAPCYWIDLDRLRSDGKSLLDTLSRNTRHQIRRSIRLYEQSGPISVERAETEGQVRAFLAGMEVYHQATWEGRGHRGAFSYPFMVAFHEQLIARCNAGGLVDLLKISVGDRPIGYIYNFVYQGDVYYYLSGFCVENDNKLKPGMVCHTACVAYYLERGLRSYDFMAGRNRYKASLGQEGPVLITALVQRPRLKLKIETALRSLKAKLTALQGRK